MREVVKVIAVLLLTMCLLFVSSLIQIGTIDPGFDVRHGITARIELERNRSSEAQHEAFRDQVMQRLEALPSVEAATYASLVPLSGDSSATRAQVKDEPNWRSPRTLLINVGPRYFETIAIPLGRGREFAPPASATAMTDIVTNVPRVPTTEDLMGCLLLSLAPIGRREETGRVVRLTTRSVSGAPGAEGA